MTQDSTFLFRSLYTCFEECTRPSTVTLLRKQLSFANSRSNEGNRTCWPGKTHEGGWVFIKKSGATTEQPPGLPLYHGADLKSWAFPSRKNFPSGTARKNEERRKSPRQRAMRIEGKNRVVSQGLKKIAGEFKASARYSVVIEYDNLESFLQTRS